MEEEKKPVQDSQEEKKSSEDELTDDQLNVSGGVVIESLLICGKCGQNPCTCTAI